MALLAHEEFVMAEAISSLAYCNPFLPDRVQLEKQLLGEDFAGGELVWSAEPQKGYRGPNVAGGVGERVQRLARTMRDRLMAGQCAGIRELELYQDVAAYALYARYGQALYDISTAPIVGPHGGARKFPIYDQFARDIAASFEIPHVRWTLDPNPAHLLALFFQLRRAFLSIYYQIVGNSGPVARLRASVWQSVFTHDLRRYVRFLYNRMGDLTTLITGPSGTGKELVARAIGLSRYIPFDPATRSFADDFTASFHPLNLSALSPTLIESELFGHRRGAFTGAIEDRIGWLEVCRPLGTVFLDEVGDVDPPIQVKLLRVLQTRTFQRLGDTEPRAFTGKIIAATNKDLAEEMRAGRFRADFYYRLCADLITTPSLRDQLRGAPAGELRDLIRFIARRVAGEAGDELADEVIQWVRTELGEDYGWPGNFRELEQCVRNVLVHHAYHPPRVTPPDRDGAERDDLSAALEAGTITAEELLQRYCAVVYARTGNYEETARRLNMDRRTVKAKLQASRGSTI